MMSLHPTRYYQILPNGRVQCDLCPRTCQLKEGQRGLCFVRACQDQAIVLTTYGRSSGFCIDPIEKKPLKHFLPGTAVLSFGTAGCNLTCRFCQNWHISKSQNTDSLSSQAAPELIAHAARQLNCHSVAYTYNDPIIFMEYAIDIAKACRHQGVRSVAVTAGYIQKEPAREFFAWMDAANVDLKSFRDNFYVKLCGGHLQPVLDTLLYLKHETSVWLELTTLLIPGENDSDEEIDAMTRWIATHLGEEVPLHFTPFHPAWRFQERGATPAETLLRAQNIAHRNGLRYAYGGSVAHTYCHRCGLQVIGRHQGTFSWQLKQGLCSQCGTPCAGIFEESPGHWGNKVVPIRLG